MVFCGKCGLQLTSGDMTCPRCGTPTEPGFIFEDSQPNNPTIASNSISGMNQSYPGTQGFVSPGTYAEQQQLILGADQQSYGAAERTAYEPTSMMGTQSAGITGQTPGRTAYSGYLPQSTANYPQPGTPYPGYAVRGGAAYQPYGTSSADAARVRARGRLVALLLILIGLLFLLCAMVLFILTHNSSTSAFSSTQQAHNAFALLCPIACLAGYPVVHN